MMKAYIKRNEEQFGPYSIEDIRSYVRTGNVVETDLCRPPEADNWITVSTWLIRFPNQPVGLPPIPSSNGNGTPSRAVVPTAESTPASSPADSLNSGPKAYYVNCRGQEYGPWSLDQIRSYVAQNRVTMSDFVRSDPDQAWVPLPAVLAAPGATSPVTPAFNGPVPPGLHWLILILIHLFTFGLFGLVWMFVQASWIRKINKNSKATGFIILSILSAVASTAATSVGGASVVMDYANMPTALVILGVLLLIASPVLFYVGIFGMKKSLESYYNTVEPIGLRLSAGMVFFFHTLYFQYHFTRIAEWRRTSILS
jgi:hypothetical protein